MTNVNEVYRALCTSLLTQGKRVGNTLELNNVKFKIDDIKSNVVGIRNISKSYLFAELIWYFCGRNDVKFISKFASLWSKITDDGQTNNSAYGDIIFNRYGFDQVNTIIRLLQADPTSRRAVINFNVPNKNVITTKDEICTICLQFLIRDNKLHCTAMMRSNDIWFGLPYDIVFFTELQKYIAHRVGVEYGTYTHFTSSLHVYDNFVEKISDAACSECSNDIRIDVEKLDYFKRIIEQKIEESETPKDTVIELFDFYEIYKEIKL